jgi:hypothetical protein
MWSTYLVQMMMGYLLAGVLVLAHLSPLVLLSSLTFILNISFLSGAPAAGGAAAGGAAGGDLPWSSMLDN